jgi:predicted transcriptional regulator
VDQRKAAEVDQSPTGANTQTTLAQPIQASRNRPRRYNRGMSTSATPKDQLRRVIDEQPDDSSFEEIIKEIAFAAMVERGLADSQAGRTISHEEMRRTLESWRK